MEYVIDNDELRELLELATKLDIEIEVFDGVLLDNYVLYDTENIEIEGKRSKYIVIKERYLNSWSSDNVVIMTDSYKEVDEYRESFQFEIE